MMTVKQMFMKRPSRNLLRTLASLLCLGILYSAAPMPLTVCAATVVAWGNNSSHQCEVPADLTDVIAVAAGGMESLALKADGTVVGWGAGFLGLTNPPAGLTNVIAISIGVSNCLALKGDGSVVGWGPIPTPSGLTTWKPLPLAPGIGAAQALSDLSASNQTRIYRIRRW
jgi:hypothetical protein